VSADSTPLQSWAQRASSAYAYHTTLPKEFGFASCVCMHSSGEIILLLLGQRHHLRNNACEVWHDSRNNPCGAQRSAAHLILETLELRLCAFAPRIRRRFEVSDLLLQIADCVGGGAGGKRRKFWDCTARPHTRVSVNHYTTLVQSLRCCTAMARGKPLTYQRCVVQEEDGDWLIPLLARSLDSAFFLAASSRFCCSFWILSSRARAREAKKEAQQTTHTHAPRQFSAARESVARLRGMG
jgi:hypothetical protein